MEPTENDLYFLIRIPGLTGVVIEEIKYRQCAEKFLGGFLKNFGPHHKPTEVALSFLEKAPEEKEYVARIRRGKEERLEILKELINDNDSHQLGQMMLNQDMRREEIMATIASFV